MDVIWVSSQHQMNLTLCKWQEITTTLYSHCEHLHFFQLFYNVIPLLIEVGPQCVGCWQIQRLQNVFRTKERVMKRFPK